MNDNVKKLLRYLSFWLLASVVLECFFFNCRFWESRSYNTVTPAVNPSYEGDQTILDLRGFDCHVNNIYLNIFPDAQDTVVTNVEITANDVTNTAGIAMNATSVVSSIKESQYIRLHLMGNTQHFKLTFDQKIPFETLRTSEIRLNAQRPFHFVLSRFAAIFLLGALIIILKSKVLAVPLNPGSKPQLLSVVLVSLVFTMIWAVITDKSYVPEYAFKYFDDIHYVEQIYNYCAQSLLKGHVYLDFEVPEFLKEMANPYVENERAYMSYITGQEYLLDYAYFNGRYYCYYGIIPVLLFYLPYVGLTGKLLHSSYVIAICGAVFIPSSFALINQVVKRFNSEIQFDSYLMISSLFINCCGFMTFVKMPGIYVVPMAVGYVFTVLGLYFWLKASSDVIRKRYLIAGAVAIALTLGCRPLAFIALFLAFPIFWKDIKEGRFFRKDRESLLNTLSVIIPFAIIDSLLAAYNYLRFGNILEFGAKYNLSRDLIDDAFVLERIPYGLFSYFLQPLTVNAQFPYVHTLNPGNNLITDYQGFIYSESFFGGVFAVIPFCLILLMYPFVRKAMKDDGSAYLVIILAAFSIILAVIDVENGGVSNRYLTDFSIYMLLAAVIVALHVGKKYPKHQRVIFIGLAVASVIFSYFLLLSDANKSSMSYMMPYEYNYFQYLIFNIR